ncbi:hypothetical protein KFZ58_17095 [Virgibacillus sp. NKC19-16]|uniref:hypothetical protein n=1 Tax=Virgibacillus salidurans TaxID=2831673 RepID=UPI001F3541C9|nr:hypothetical protein [Virgibacillus sp. NKC19-16]UJL46056.1 hypothetical protein KFZ58_17095 [Virgibacillus sp. NKC19-16]
MFIQVGIFVVVLLGIWLLSRVFSKNRKNLLVGLGMAALLFALVTNLNNLGDRSFLTMFMLCSAGLIFVYRNERKKSAN